MDRLIYATVDIEGKEVLLTTPRHLRDLVNKANGRDIFGSRFYNDVIASQPYLTGPDFVFNEDMKKAYPKEYREAMSYLIDAGVAKRDSTFLLTDKGVMNILYVFKIDPQTLLLGGEKIPVKQNALFSGTPETTVSSEARKIAAKLFPTSTQKKRQVKNGRLTRLHKPGVSIRDEKSDRLINLSKPLMALLYKIPYIASVQQSASTALYADVSISEIEGVTFLGFKFHEEGDFPFVLRRDHGDNIVGIRNIFFSKGCPEAKYRKMLRLLKSKKLIMKDLYNPEIIQDVIFFRVEV